MSYMGNHYLTTNQTQVDKAHSKLHFDWEFCIWKKKPVKTKQMNKLACISEFLSLLVANKAEYATKPDKSQTLDIVSVPSFSSIG